MIQGAYIDNNSYRDEWKVSLIYWNSNENYSLYWKDAPSYYSKKIDSSNTFYFDSGVNSAITQWSNALSMSLDYETESKADIKIYGASRDYLVNVMGVNIGTNTVGLTENTFLGDSITFDYFGVTKTIKPTLEAKVYICSGGLGEANQKNVVVHEFGHALGYVGHSGNSNDVMYTNNHSGFTLTQNDINHLKFIYTCFR